jgi:hypothetical protein
MLQIYAHQYLLLGASLNNIKRAVDEDPEGGVQIEDGQDRDKVANFFDLLRGHAIQLQLPVSMAILKEDVEDIKSGKVATYRDSSTRLRVVERVIHKELQERLFLFVPPHRGGYYSADGELPLELDFRAVVQKFPSSKYDLIEAGNCYAADRHTACVYHLARVTELGMIAFATKAGVSADDCINWNKALNLAQKYLSEKTHGFTGLDKLSEEYYSEVLLWLRNFKTARRNPVSHAPRVYTEPLAYNMFNIVKNLMTLLCVRLSEIPQTASEDDELGSAD